METISLIMLILGLIGILFGFLYGLRRGFSKSVVRLILILISLVIAFYSRTSYTETLIDNLLIDGKTIAELITESFSDIGSPEATQSIVNIVLNIIKMTTQIFVFIITFFILRVFSMIIYWIITIIINSINKEKTIKVIKKDINSLNKGKHSKFVKEINEDYALLNDENLNEKQRNNITYRIAKNEKKLMKKVIKRNKKKWLGSLVGLVQGTIIVICVAGPLNGLITNVGGLIETLSTVEIDGSKILEEDMIEPFEELGIFTYKDSTISKVYTYASDGLYKEMSKITNEDGSAINIKSQIEAIDGGVKMVDAVSKLTNLDMENGLTENVKNELVEIFNDLDSIKNDMSQESIEQLDNLIKDAVTPMLDEYAQDLPIDLDKIDFTDVNFAKEGEVIDSLYDLIESSTDLTEEEILEEAITNLSQSTLVLPIATQIIDNLAEEDKPTFTDEQKETIE